MFSYCIYLYLNITIYSVEAKSLFKRDLLILRKRYQKGYFEIPCVFVGYIRIYNRCAKIVYDLKGRAFRRKITYTVIWIAARMGAYHIYTIYIHTAYAPTSVGYLSRGCTYKSGSQKCRSFEL